MSNFDESFDRISFNSNVFALLFSMLSLKVTMFQRFIYFFIPYMTVYIPNLNTRFRDKNTKLFFDVLLYVVCTLYVWITQNNAIFIWK